MLELEARTSAVYHQPCVHPSGAGPRLYDIYSAPTVVPEGSAKKSWSIELRRRWTNLKLQESYLG